MFANIYQIPVPLLFVSLNSRLHGYAAVADACSADIVPLEKRGAYQGFLGSSWGIAAVILISALLLTASN